MPSCLSVEQVYDVEQCTGLGDTQMLRVNSIRWNRDILKTVQDNGKAIANTDWLWDFIMSCITTLFMAVVLLVGVVVMWVGILSLSILCFVFMLVYLF